MLQRSCHALSTPSLTLTPDENDRFLLLDLGEYMPTRKTIL